MTSGTIADLARAQSEYRMEYQAQDGLKEENVHDDSNKKRWNYEPIKPFELTIISKTP